MFRKKCSNCKGKVAKSFSYCPHCGTKLIKKESDEDYGLLGRYDEIPTQEFSFPPGINKVLNSLIKQLEKQIEEMDIREAQSYPRGLKIKISAANPTRIDEREMQKRNEPIKNELKDLSKISEKEIKRRENLERVEAISKVRRLADKIIYEIEAPGVKMQDDVTITELASGIEIKIYTKDKCYIKFIPLKVEVIGYKLDKDKVLVELKS